MFQNNYDHVKETDVLEDGNQMDMFQMLQHGWRVHFWRLDNLTQESCYESKLKCSHNFGQ